MWNEKKSLILSKILNCILLVILCVFLVIAPKLVKWLMSFSLSGLKTEYFGYFLATVYIGGVISFILLITLYTMLDNISKEKIFISQNITCMRIISWCCFIGSIICLISSFYYIPWIFISFAAVFIGLIVRIIKNLLAKAILIKEENELTI